MIKSLVATILLGVVTLAAWADGGVTYEVPVTDTNLKTYSTFDLADFKEQTVGTQVQMSFTLPRELTGVRQQVVFRGVPDVEDPLVLTGPNGTMYCSDTACSIDSYQNITTDLSSVQAYLKTSTSSPLEYNARLQVAEMFSGDPGGVLHFATPAK